MKTNSAVSKRGHLVWVALALIIGLISCGKDNNNPQPNPGNNKMEVTGFSPAHGAPGAVVKINGKNFKASVLQNQVLFNGAVLGALIKNATTEELTVEVPADATTGKIIVKTGNEADTTTTNFTVDPVTVAITGFTPKQGPFGTTVTITGTQFGSNIVVKINDIVCPLVSRSTTQIVATIPVNTTLTTHKITVTSGTDVLQTAENFTVTSAGPYASWLKRNISFVAEGSSVFTSGLSFVYRNKIYWGFTGISSFENEADYVVFDPARSADGWVLQNHPPAAMAAAKWKHATAIVQNNRVFMGTGFINAASNQWWEFFPETNTATRLTDYPEATADAVSFVVNNHIYAGFGGTSKKLYQFNPAGNNNLGSWDLTATGTFSELNSGNSFVLGNEVFLGRALPATNQTRNAVYKFTEPAQLTRVTDMPEDLPSLNTPSFTIGNKGYFVIQKNVWEYTPGTNGGSWRVVISGTNAPAIIHVAAITINGAQFVYGWTSSGSLYEFYL